MFSFYRHDCSCDDLRDVRADSIGQTKQQFNARITKPPFNESNHRFRNPGTLGNCVLCQFPLFPFLLQEANDFFSDGFVIGNTRHTSGLQEQGLDTYCAVVQYRYGSCNRGLHFGFFPTFKCEHLDLCGSAGRREELGFARLKILPPEPKPPGAALHL
jgi:hypothetical protein